MAQRFVTKSEFNKLSAKVDNLFKEMEEQTALIKKLVNGKTASNKKPQTATSQNPQRKGSKKPVQTVMEAWTYVQPILSKSSSIKEASTKTIFRIKADDYKSWKSIHRSMVALGFEGNYEKLHYDMSMSKWENVKKEINKIG